MVTKLSALQFDGKGNNIGQTKGEWQMVLKRNRDWQHRRRRRNDDGQEIEGGHDNESQDNEKQDKDASKSGVMFVRMSMPQFTNLFMTGYRLAKEEGFSEKEAEDFGVFTATRYLALCVEDRLAKEEAAKQEGEDEMDDEEDEDEEDDNE